MTFNIIGQLLTFISYAIFWISRFLNSKRKMLVLDNLSRIAAIISFICLGSVNGIMNTLFVMVRNYCGQKTESMDISVKRKTFLVLLIILIFMYTVTYGGISTIALFICAVFNLIGVILCDEQGIRLYGLGGSAFYAIFLLLIHNYTGFVCEIICAVILVSSYLMYKNKERLGE